MKTLISIRAACMSVVVWVVACPVLRGADPPPNIVFVLADDMGFGDCGFNGAPRIRTPGLDRMAREGVNLGRFYSSSPYCSASRIAFLTGRYPARQNVLSVLADSDAALAFEGIVPLLPVQQNYLKFFRAHGYEVAHLGKWHVSSGLDSPFTLASYGIDSVKMLGSGYVGSWSNGWWQDSATRLGDDAVAFINQQSGDRPFFLQVWLHTPHTPVSPYSWQRARYSGVPFDPAEFGARWERAYMEAVGDLFTEGDFLEAMRRYSTEVSKIDDQVIRIRAALEAKGFADETIVVFTSDNGPETVFLDWPHNPGCGSTGDLRGRKRSLYEGGLRVPFVAVGPGVPNLENNETMVTAIDFWPTLASWAGLEVQSALDGSDLSADIAAARDSGQWRFWRTRSDGIDMDENRSPPAAVSTGRWKLLKVPGETGHELYDLWTDEAEENDLAGSIPFFEVALAAALDAFETTYVPAAPLVVYESPSMTIGPGERISLRCQVASLGELSYQWFRNGRAIGDGEGTSGHRGFELTLGPLQEGAEYHCVATSPLGSVSSSPMRIEFMVRPGPFRSIRKTGNAVELTIRPSTTGRFSLSRGDAPDALEPVVEDVFIWKPAVYSEAAGRHAFFRLEAE